MRESVGEKGYRATTISDVVGRAGVSRKTFYEHFANKQECLLATFDEIQVEARSRVTSAFEGSGDLHDRVEAAIRALFEATIDNPAAARLSMVEITAAGPAGIERRERATAEYGLFVRGILEEKPGGGAVPDTVVRGIVGGMNRVLYTCVQGGKRAELLGLVPDVMRWVTSYRPTPQALIDGIASIGPIATREPGGLTGGRAPGTLSPGPDADLGLSRCASVSRGFVLYSQRERILDAVTNLIAVGGYPELTVEKIAAEAAISLQTFYEHFKSKEEALLLAYEVGHARGLGLVERAYAAETEWTHGVRAAVSALVHYLSSEPAFAQLSLLHMLIATPRAAERASASITNYVQMLEPGFERIPESLRPPAIAIEAIGGGLFDLLYQCVLQGRVLELPRLETEMTYVALAPFVGPEQAAQVACAPLA
jgi:AcrR family transcriptional regulator